MRATWFLLKHYLIPRQGNLLSFALWIAVGGVAIGIAQLMLVLAVMSGFLDFLSNSYTRITSPLVIIPNSDRFEEKAFERHLKNLSSFDAVSPFMLGQAMLIKDGVGGVVLEGIDPGTTGAVTPWQEIWTESPTTDIAAQEKNWIWLGSQLAKKVQAKVGDTVSVFIPGKPLTPFKVTAITKFGIYDHDLRHARLSRQALTELVAPDSLEVLYKVKLAKGVTMNHAAIEVERTMGKHATVKKWSEVNQNLFRAVQHQKLMLFAILEIVISLAAINVVNLLMMSAYQRRRDVAILRAMGMRFRHVVVFFVAQGAAVGGLGIMAGIGLGLLLCRLVERFQPALLSESVYNVTRLPLRVEPLDIASVAVIAFFLCVCFSTLPALRAAKRPVVASLRYE